MTSCPRCAVAWTSLRSTSTYHCGTSGGSGKVFSSEQTGRGSDCEQIGRGSDCEQIGRGSDCEQTGKSSDCEQIGRGSNCEHTGKGSNCEYTERGSNWENFGSGSNCEQTGRDPVIQCHSHPLARDREEKEQWVGTNLVGQLMEPVCPTESQHHCWTISDLGASGPPDHGLLPQNGRGTWSGLQCRTQSRDLWWPKVICQKECDSCDISSHWGC